MAFVRIWRQNARVASTLVHPLCRSKLKSIKTKRQREEAKARKAAAAAGGDGAAVTNVQVKAAVPEGSEVTSKPEAAAAKKRAKRAKKEKKAKKENKS